jgi:CHAT domain-containing protein
MGEGVFGLQRAFALSGARTVMASLWNVPDDATRLLMTRFHENLWGSEREGKVLPPMPRALALREAELWLREKIAADEGLRKQLREARGPLHREVKVDNDDPVLAFAWAAFTLAGDWR